MRTMLGLMALAHSVGMALGTPAPSFSLPGVDDETYRLDSWPGAKVLVVIFTCNHCPYAQAYESRFVAMQAELGPRGVQLVAINPNDARSHPDDSFEQMQIRAHEQGFNFPYLRDESQEVARSYGAGCTPDLFVFDAERTLRYNGRVDDSWRDPTRVERQDLRLAIESTLTGEPVDFEVIPAMGCSIKWKA